MKSLHRYMLGVKYQQIARDLYFYDMVPRYLWTREQKEKVVELLEQEAVLDQELAAYLIKDRDEQGLKVFNANKRTNALALWDLKQELAIG